MRRLLLTPRWLLRHVLALVLMAACLALGLWQWERAGSASGGAQNIGYALQWPLFAGFVGLVWWRLLRIEAARAPDAPPSAPEPAARRPLRRRPPPVRAVDDADDPRLAAYNRYLRSLDEKEQQR